MEVQGSLGPSGIGIVIRLLNFLMLAAVKIWSQIFFRIRFAWLHDPAPAHWKPYRLVVILNHTSLFEWIYAGGVPFSFLWRIANHAVVPVADKTLRRPVIGWFFKLLAPNVISITRQADSTWEAVLDRIGEDSMVIILPEGRMKRADGRDHDGQAMTVRGGVADILQAITSGTMLIAYSGGLHHVQIPGQRLPRLFKTVKMNLEEVDIESYRSLIGEADQPARFKRRVKADLEQRRDSKCPDMSDV